MRRHLLLASALALLGVSACGGDSEPAAGPATSTAATTTETQPETTTEPEPTTTEETTTEETTTEAEPPAPNAPPGVPGFVAGYRSWTKLNEAPIPPRDADPHNGTKNVYVSREQRANGRYPPGTIVVKDAARPGTDFIGLIAIMRKVPGADPAHNNWVFVEYTRDARSQRFQEIASGAVCWSCHMGALDNDYVFTE
ncbi:MAG TPA: cytochrome P460 family protein [Gaiellaceae bacterium]|nr:cytochrome P460 family protein [Gaiellaceae bacterium]